MLRFKAERTAPLVRAPGLAYGCAVQVVAGVELHTGLRGADVQRAACPVMCGDRCRLQAARLSSQHKVVIVASSVDELWMHFVDPLTDALR